MTNKQYELLNNINKANELISVENLCNIKDRTLLYGYNYYRTIFHVYLKNRIIHTVLYKTIYSDLYLTIKPINMIEISVMSNYDYVPNKRLYPEACDYEFCKLLKERNIILPFTIFDNKRDMTDFYGFTLEDM